MRVLITILMTLGLFGAKAQTMVDTGKVWNVAECLNFGPCGTINYSFGGDTTIGLHQYKLLIVDNDSAAFGSPYEPIALREDTAMKQIYFYDYGGDALVYDFSLTQGASYTTTWRSCTLSITADSVDNVILLNGELRKRVFVTITKLSGSCFWGSFTETWIEGIGSLMGLTSAMYYSFVADVYPELICFHENDTMKYHNANYSSCFFTTVGVEELYEVSPIKIFPNPTSDVVSIQYDAGMKLHSVIILNFLGRTLMATSKPEIDLSQLAEGIYFVQVKTDKGNYQAKVLRK